MSTPSLYPSLVGQTVLALHAHPDDEAIFTGITLRRLADAGARTVLVVATAGELGSSRVELRRGESVPQRRVAELERAAELLGVARLVLLGRRDSGLPGWSSGRHARALATAPILPLARSVAELADAEGAATIVHDDENGIYGHPDHRVAHRVGATAAAMIGAVAYRTTVDRDRLDCHIQDSHTQPHLVHGAAGAARVSYGRPSAEITVSLAGSAAELDRKRAAILAHESQVAPADVPAAGFAGAYGREWFSRTGAPGVIDELAAAAARPREQITGA